jgi:hypothetical protein
MLATPAHATLKPSHSFNELQLFAVSYAFRNISSANCSSVVVGAAPACHARHQDYKNSFAILTLNRLGQQS